MQTWSAKKIYDNINAVLTELINTNSKVLSAFCKYFTETRYIGGLGVTIPTYAWWYATLEDTRLDSDWSERYMVRIDVDIYTYQASSNTAANGWDLGNAVSVISSVLSNYIGRTIVFKAEYSRPLLRRVEYPTGAGDLKGYAPTVVHPSNNAYRICMSRRYEQSNADGGWGDNVIPSGTSASFSVFYMFG